MHNILHKYLGKSAMLWSPENEGGGGGGGDIAQTQQVDDQAGTTLLGGFQYEGDAVNAGEGNGGTGDEEPEEQEEYIDDPDLSAEENAAKKVEHDEAKQKAKEEKKDDEEGEPAPKPEDYEIIDVPEGFELSEEIEGEFRQLAAENKLSKETVTKLQELQVKLINKQSEEHVNRVKKWGEDLKADKEIGGKALKANIGAAISAMNEFFSPSARSILDTTGLGNHPDIVRGFVRLGKAMGENPSLRGTPVTRPTTIADALYPAKSGDSDDRA